MKEQWSIRENNIELAILEEGLYQEKQKCIKIEYETNCCKRGIRYLKLILLLEITLFFGWGCYTILQPYLSQVMENEATSVITERYPSIIESLSKIQESRPNAEVPAILIKTDVIIDNINNLSKDMKLTKGQNLMQNEDIASIVQTILQTSNNVQSNNVGISDIDTSSGNFVHNESFTNSLVPEKLASIESTDENDGTYKKQEFAGYAQFLEQLRKIIKVKATDDLEKVESGNGVTEDIDRLTLKAQENHASNKLERLEFNVATILDLENIDRRISVDLINTLRDLKEKFSDLAKDVTQDDPREDNSSFDETDKQVNVRLEDLVICPPYESDESSDMPKDSAKGFSIFQPVLAEKISEQVENESSDDIDERNEKHDVNDSDMSMLAFVSGNQDYFVFDTSVTVQNTEEQHPSESISKIMEDEKYESTEKIKNPYKLGSLQPTVQDSVESSTPNVDKFEWFNMPPRFVDLEWGDTSKSSETNDSLFSDTYEEVVDDVIPESQCNITINMGILKVKCPAIKFDEKWNFTTSKMSLTDILKVINLEDIFDIFLRTECDDDASGRLGFIENTFNENSDEEVTTPRDIIPEIINRIKWQESTSAKILHDMLLDLFDTEDAASIDPFDSGDISVNCAYDDLNEEGVEQVTTESSYELGSKKQIYLLSDTEAFALEFKHFYNLEKDLVSRLKSEMSNVMTRYLPSSSHDNNYRNNICSIVHYIRSISHHPWHEHHAALRELWEYLQNHDCPHGTDDDYHRKKRMVDDLTWQQDEVSNTLEQDVNVLEKLKKLFQKMEIVALCIDRIHERYLLHNKLDDDYASSEFPI